MKGSFLIYDVLEDEASSWPKSMPAWFYNRDRREPGKPVLFVDPACPPGRVYFVGPKSAGAVTSLFTPAGIEPFELFCWCGQRVKHCSHAQDASPSFAEEMLEPALPIGRPGDSFTFTAEITQKDEVPYVGGLGMAAMKYVYAKAMQEMVEEETRSLNEQLGRALFGEGMEPVRWEGQGRFLTPFDEDEAPRPRRRKKKRAAREVAVTDNRRFVNLAEIPESNKEE